MKEIKKKEEVKTVNYRTVYEAWDGTVFECAEECTKYENSATAVLIATLKDAIVNNDASADWFDEGSENEYKVIVPKKEEHINTLNQLWFMYGGKDNFDNPKFSEADIWHPILMGYRIYNGGYDWLWFYKLVENVEMLTDKMFTVTLKEADGKDF